MYFRGNLRIFCITFLFLFNLYYRKAFAKYFKIVVVFLFVFETQWLILIRIYFDFNGMFH